MKNILIFTAIAALTILGGCTKSNKSSASESENILKLKTEKAQIVQELEAARKELNAEIDQKDEKIKQLEEENALLTKQITGFEGIINQMIGKFQEISQDAKVAKDENKQLKDELAKLKASDSSSPEPLSQEVDSNAKNRLDALKSLKEAE